MLFFNAGHLLPFNVFIENFLNLGPRAKWVIDNFILEFSLTILTKKLNINSIKNCN
jgi:hypothetical protein